MAIPSVGTTWRAGGFGTVDSRFNARGGLAAILVRDDRGPATNISPWAAGSPPTRNWSPFALDGRPRADLFTVLRDSTGEWVTNPNPNEGFWIIGANSEDGGAERAPDVKNDTQKILQNNFAFDSDLVDESMMINFTGVETLKPLMKRLRMNLPLSDSAGNPIVEDPGTENFVMGKPLDSDSVERQIILMFAKRKSGKVIYTAEIYPLCKLANIGNFKRSKTDPDAGQLGWEVLPNPYFVGKDPSNPGSDTLVPLMFAELVSGDGWVSIGGAPTWGALAPVATAGGAGAVSIVTDQATGAGDPFTYTLEYKQGAGAWTTIPIANLQPNVPGSGKVTLGVTGVPAGSTVFRITAKGSNGQTAVSQTTAAVTVS